MIYVSFTASSGEFVALVGPSGCGKSTLLRLVAGLLAPDSGQIDFAGWPQLPKRRLVFQDHALLSWMTVADNIAFGLELPGASRRWTISSAWRWPILPITFLTNSPVT